MMLQTYGYKDSVVTSTVLLLASVGLISCKDLSGLAGSQQLPAGTPNPSVYQTAAGAMELYQGTLIAFQANTQEVSDSAALAHDNNNLVGVFVEYLLATGVFTDELQPAHLGCTLASGCDNNGGSYPDLDTRQLPENTSHGSDQVYTDLQAIRNAAAMGIGALSAYDDSAPPALRGHLAAMQGYAEVFLADLFCSGVPLSTLNFGQSYTYQAGSTTQAVYQDASTKFRMAIILADSSDSVRIRDLARVGLGRSLLALGAYDYDSAAQAVASVPDTFVYSFPVNWGAAEVVTTGPLFTMSDHEGTTGLPFVSQNDPRTQADTISTNQYGLPIYWPVAYGGISPGVFPVHVADGVEARLIQAEAALHDLQYGPYLSFLNRARAVAAPSLAPLVDPGDSPHDSARVALLFRERAFDLYLTGHRQGDLRRLLRDYKSIYPSQFMVYPSGAYPFPKQGGVSQYGPAVNAPIPVSEDVNPKFHGCLSRSA